MAVTQSQNINLVIDQGADFSKNLTVTTDGTANTGSGGGGGGKGLVVIRYKFQ